METAACWGRDTAGDGGGGDGVVGEVRQRGDGGQQQAGGTEQKGQEEESDSLGLIAAGNICLFFQALTAAAVSNPPTDD